ncbi:hypothetical protein GOP47_0009196 [Adiantum capillus-veneris]|uniref:Pentatricopeptide repeat-containing protein n=1 Tax=Adiantum capillus-veneris TaxID=13818 RepID=A0A9D4UVS3_ADICA|nr:hypothetical protein GOP47_0009196 [Adiantum capillus-veneris]
MLVHKNVEKATSLKLLCLFNRMDELPMIEDVISLLQSCRRKHDPKLMEEVHVHICFTGLDIHKDVGNHVVPLLVECTNVGDVAQQAFNRMDYHSVHSWNSLISGFAKHGKLENALGIYRKMQEDNMPASSHTFVALLQSCAAIGALDVGRMLHSTAIQDGYESDVFVGSRLVDTYSKIGFLADAYVVFHQLSVQDIVTWNALIAAQTEQGGWYSFKSCVVCLWFETLWKCWS